MLQVPSKQKRELEIACEGESNVLITGPTGAGKSTLASWIHDRSRRRTKPFVTINLATLHEGTLESELFGHEKGAFTGADRRRPGRLEQAHGGTVFLDEIGELPPRLQARLLDFLQSKRVTPVGGNRELILDVRVIAATNRDLTSAVKDGSFREDLFYRLRVLTVNLRPLAERCDDFDELVHHCLDDVSRAAGKPIRRISERLAASLERYHWPGNIRELRNVLEYAVHACDGDLLDEGDLPRWFQENADCKGEGETLNELGRLNVALSTDYHETISRFEREYIRVALARYRGRINQTARLIGLNKTTLLRRMKVYGLSVQGVVVPNLSLGSLNVDKPYPDPV